MDDGNLWEFSERWHVRQYELDSWGHVNNAVYLNYAEQVAVDHAESIGIGHAFSERHGGGWVVREHQITYHQPAIFGDEVDITTRVEQLKGIRGLRRTFIRRVSDGALLAEALTDWIWIRTVDGRPMRIPAELVDRYRLPE